MKHRLVLFFSVVICPYVLYSHSGGTDRNGGHHDRKNGGYHFHHGQGPHQHPNGKCPYKNNSSNDESKPVTIWYALGGIGLVGGIYVYNRSNE